MHDNTGKHIASFHSKNDHELDGIRQGTTIKNEGNVCNLVDCQEGVVFHVFEDHVDSLLESSVMVDLFCSLI